MPTSSAVGDLAHAVVEDGVAGDPEHAVLLALPAQREADHVADDRVAQRRAVAAGRGGDLDRRPAPAPRASWSPTARARARRRRAASRPDTVVTTDAGRRQQRPAGRVEVVAVVVVAEQHRVDRPRSAAAIAGPASLRDTVPQPKKYASGRRVERRVGQQPPAADLDQDRRPADVRDVHTGTNVIRSGPGHPSMGSCIG